MQERKKDIRLYGVLNTHIDSIWPDISPMIEKAIFYSDGKFQTDDIYECLKAREMQLWVAYDNNGLKACCVTQIINYPRKKVMLIVVVSGSESQEWLHFYENLKQFAKDHECDSLETYGRPGWERLGKHLGLKKIHTVFKFDTN